MSEEMGPDAIELPSYLSTWLHLSFLFTRTSNRQLA
jgi:hypothetical protein